MKKNEKAKYEEAAQEWKIIHHGRNARPDNEKLDCFGIPVVNHDAYEDILKENEPMIQKYTRDYATCFLDGKVELLLVSYQSMFDDPDEHGFLPVELCLLRYKFDGGINNGENELYHSIINPGAPPYGMRAECRQYAARTHHIDPYNDRFSDILEQNCNNDSIPEIWCNMIDLVHASQIKTDADREYLCTPAGRHLIHTFCTHRELLQNEYCHEWMYANFSGEPDVADNEENAKYFETDFETPIAINDLIKEFYRIRNEDLPLDQKFELPSDIEIERDVDKSYYCANHTLRCNYHEEIDIDFCSRMECHRAVYTISRHLKRLGYQLNGNHFPVKDDEIVEESCSFQYIPTEGQKAYEKKRRMQLLIAESEYSFERTSASTLGGGRKWGISRGRGSSLSNC